MGGINGVSRVYRGCEKKESSPPLVERRRHPYQTCCDLGEASEQGPGMQLQFQSAHKLVVFVFKRTPEGILRQ